MNESFSHIPTQDYTWQPIGELAGIVPAVEYVSKNDPVDTGRIYAAGFSNGAVSVAPAGEYPQMLAVISANGWMADMRSRDGNHDMPFQIFRGAEEYAYAAEPGAMAVMEDEQRAIRSLLLSDEMIHESTQADYGAAPYPPRQFGRGAYPAHRAIKPFSAGFCSVLRSREKGLRAADLVLKFVSMNMGRFLQGNESHTNG